MKIKLKINCNLEVNNRSRIGGRDGVREASERLRSDTANTKVPPGPVEAV